MLRVFRFDPHVRLPEDDPRYEYITVLDHSTSQFAEDLLIPGSLDAYYLNNYVVIKRNGTLSLRTDQNPLKKLINGYVLDKVLFGYYEPRTLPFMVYYHRDEDLAFAKAHCTSNNAVYKQLTAPTTPTNVTQVVNAMFFTHDMDDHMAPMYYYVKGGTIWACNALAYCCSFTTSQIDQPPHSYWDIRKLAMKEKCCSDYTKTIRSLSTHLGVPLREAPYPVHRPKFLPGEAAKTPPLAYRAIMI